MTVGLHYTSPKRRAPNLLTLPFELDRVIIEDTF